MSSIFSLVSPYCKPDWNWDWEMHGTCGVLRLKFNLVEESICTTDTNFLIN